MKPIGYKTDSYNVDETKGFIRKANGKHSSRGARKDKKKTTRHLKRSEKNIFVI